MVFRGIGVKTFGTQRMAVSLFGVPEKTHGEKETFKTMYIQDLWLHPDSNAIPREFGLRAASCPLGIQATFGGNTPPIGRIYECWVNITDAPAKQEQQRGTTNTHKKTKKLSSKCPD